MKYRRFVDAIGGWDVLQAVLARRRQIAAKHGVSISNVATRWVLRSSGGRRRHRRRAARRARAPRRQSAAVRLRARRRGPRARSTRPSPRSTRIPGDCGDEYRKPPFLTASGDLSHHLAALPQIWPRSRSPAGRAAARRQRQHLGAARRLSRAVRIGDRILVSGTTATHGSGRAGLPRRCRRRRRSTSSTRSPPASARSAAASTTSCARASI